MVIMFWFIRSSERRVTQADKGEAPLPFYTACGNAAARSQARATVKIERGIIKMKKLNNAKITRYEEGNFWIDIVESESEFEAWLQERHCGVSSLMFGFPKEQFTDGEKLVVDNDFFCELVEANLDEYIEDYIEDYMQKDDICQHCDHGECDFSCDSIVCHGTKAEQWECAYHNNYSIAE